MTNNSSTGLPTFEQLFEASSTNAPTSEQLRQHFAPVFEKIRSGAKQRELDHELAFEAIELLRTSGFTRVRLAREHGGIGASLPQLAELLIDLGQADSNLPQALHGHLMFTEQHQAESQGGVSAWWLQEVAKGKIFGNALVELPPSAGKRPVYWVDETNPEAEGVIALLSGDKFYSTGAIFSDYLLVSATREGREEEGPLFAIVDAHHQGVQRIDDWNGFGQRLTASGTTLLNDVPVLADRVQEFDVPTGVLSYNILWLVLIATQTGIGQNALADITEYVATRRRTYNHTTVEAPAEDPVIHQVIGTISAKISAARHIVTGVAAIAQNSFERVSGHKDLEDPVFLQAHTAANVALSEASVVVSELILDATNQIFEAGGASATDASKQLHQHWLNVRVIASHTPLVYRAQGVGNFRLNGIVPPHHSTARNSAPQEATK